MISDINVFLQRVMEQALAKSPHLNSALVSQDKNESETYLAEVLGERLAAIFETDESSESDRGEDSDRNPSPDLLAHYEELLERNATLALALGACDCWGEVEDCDVCMGMGTPGWMTPNKQLFSKFIRPAFQTARNHRSVGSSSRRAVIRNNKRR
jgi:hypothetical protein